MLVIHRFPVTRATMKGESHLIFIKNSVLLYLYGLHSVTLCPRYPVTQCAIIDERHLILVNKSVVQMCVTHRYTDAPLSGYPGYP